MGFVLLVLSGRSLHEQVGVSSYYVFYVLSCGSVAADGEHWCLVPGRSSHSSVTASPAYSQLQNTTAGHTTTTRNNAAAAADTSTGTVAAPLTSHGGNANSGWDVFNDDECEDPVRSSTCTVSRHAVCAPNNTPQEVLDRFRHCMLPTVP